MVTSPTPYVIGVRFSKVGKVYHFTANHIQELKVGDSIIVETARGWQLGEVAQLVEEPVTPPDGGWKSVDRLATPRDLLLRQLWQLRELDVVEACKKRAAELRIQNMKIVSAEYSFDGSRLSIMFSTEGEEKVDLKSLRQDMQKRFNNSQVELRQIGPRDVAKIIGGMGACGLETRCCSKFLTDFSSISIRMAKEQGISLTPTEITGMCGRLRCCLIYEFDHYMEARKGLPKRNKRIQTPAGEGKVIDVQPLAGMVRVDIPEVGIREFSREQLAGSPASLDTADSVDDDDSEVEEKPIIKEQPTKKPDFDQNRQRPPQSNNRSGIPHGGRRRRGGKKS